MAAPIDFSVVTEIFKINELKSFQKDALTALIVEERDVFVSVSTGGGKSMCYLAFPSIWKQLHPDNSCKILIISPLISIMKEQCHELIELGFEATYIGKDAKENDDILCGKYTYIFTSPESILSVSKWRERLVQNPVQLIVVDEAHTVLHWGEATQDEDPFREWYGRLGEIRSLVNCPVILLTATANRVSRKQIQDKFCLTDFLEIVDNPDRPNIKLFVQRVQCLSYNELFRFVIEGVITQREYFERLILFCTSIKTCSELYTTFRIELKDDMKYINMFHSKTTEDIKEEIRLDMNNPNGTIRLLLATSAAGMGVNFQGVKHVIHYGPPRDMDSFVQQFGRAGRDGEFATALLLYNGRQANKRKIDSDMSIFIQSNEKCRREILLSIYKNKPKKVRDFHSCCDICAKQCSISDCELCVKTQHQFYKYGQHEYEDSSSESTDTWSDVE